MDRVAAVAVRAIERAEFCDREHVDLGNEGVEVRGRGRVENCREMSRGLEAGSECNHV